MKNPLKKTEKLNYVRVENDSEFEEIPVDQFDPKGYAFIGVQNGMKTYKPIEKGEADELGGESASPKLPYSEDTILSAPPEILTQEQLKLIFLNRIVVSLEKLNIQIDKILK